MTTHFYRRCAIAGACTAILALVCQVAHAVNDCDFNGKRIDTGNGAATAGKTGMVRCKDRDSGQMVREYELQNGERVGLFRYFEDGKPSREFTVTANGSREGLERQWAASGQLVLEFNNVKGTPRGLRRQWFEDGKPRKVEWVADSEYEGASVEYSPSGQLTALRCGPQPLLAPHVDDAKLCGFGAPSTVNQYSFQGDVRRTSLWIKGVEQKATSFGRSGTPELVEELVGTQKREAFYADGNKRREKLWDASGRPMLLLKDAEFQASGALVVERNYTIVEVNGRKRGRLASEARYYLNGQPQSKDVYTMDGTIELRDTQRFNDQGKLRQQGRYALGGGYGEQAVGVHQSFYANGRQAKEDTYGTQGHVIRQKVWDESGVLQSDDALFEDGSRKAFSK